MSTSSPSALFGPGFLEDPYAVYVQLRRTSPVFRVPVPVEAGAGVYVLTRHADVQQLLRDAAFSADRRHADVIQCNRARLLEEFLGEAGPFRSVLTVDPPDHTRVCSLVSTLFQLSSKVGMGASGSQNVAGDWRGSKPAHSSRVVRTGRPLPRTSSERARRARSRRAA